jgi:hypothetical protein
MLAGIAITGIAAFATSLSDDLKGLLVATGVAMVSGGGYAAGKPSAVKESVDRVNRNTPILLCLLCLGALLLTACTISKSEIDKEGNILSTEGPQSKAAVRLPGETPDGIMPFIAANYNGAAPTITLQDDNGTWIATPGGGAAISFNPTTGTWYMWSPKNMKIGSFSYTPEPKPGEAAIVASGIDANMSDVEAVRAEMFRYAMEAIQGMQREAAEAKVRQLAEAGKITGEVAKLIIEGILPTMP